MPGDLAHYWHAESDEPKPPLGWLGRMLNLPVATSDVVLAITDTRRPIPAVL